MSDAGLAERLVVKRNSNGRAQAFGASEAIVGSISAERANSLWRYDAPIGSEQYS